MDPASKNALTSVEARELLSPLLTRRGEARLEGLLDSPNPRALTAAMAPAEVFFTYAQLDEEGCRALLGLCSAEQLQYLLDLDLWDKDRLDEERVLAWLERLAAVEVDQLASWLLSVEIELVASILRLLCEVTEGPSSSDASLTEETDHLPPFTAEGVYYIQFKSERAAEALKAPLLLMAGSELELYLSIMQSVASVVPAVAEETAYAQRWRRLRDEGFLPADEAYDLYRWPARSEELATEASQLVIEDGYAPTALALVEPRGILAAAIARVDESLRHQLSQAIAVTSTRVLAADHLTFSDIDDHRRALEKTLGYITIGLQHLAGDDELGAAAALRHRSPVELFRHGYARVAALGRRALVLRRQGWLTQVGLGLEVLDEPLAEVVRALARPRPLYPASALDGEAAEREFRDLSEVERCNELLAEAEAYKLLFIDALGLDLAPAHTFDLAGCHPENVAELTLGLILRTAIAAWLLTGKLHFVPAAAVQLSELIERVRLLTTTAFEADVLSALRQRLDTDDESLRRVEHIVAENLAILTSTLAGIDERQGVDPRFVGAIVVRDV